MVRGGAAVLAKLDTKSRPVKPAQQDFSESFLSFLGIVTTVASKTWHKEEEKAVKADEAQIKPETKPEVLAPTPKKMAMQEAEPFQPFDVLPHDIIIVIIHFLMQRCQFGPCAGAACSVFKAGVQHVLAHASPSTTIKAPGGCLYLAKGGPLDEAAIQAMINGSPAQLFIESTGGFLDVGIQPITFKQPGLRDSTMSRNEIANLLSCVGTSGWLIIRQVARCELDQYRILE